MVTVRRTREAETCSSVVETSRGGALDDDAANTFEVIAWEWERVVVRDWSV